MIRVEDQTVFIIDFGLARLFCNPATYLHILYSTNHSVIGTVPFMSINGQQGHAQSRHDDLESLAYAIIFSVCGSLPWTSRSSKVTLKKKLSITAEELCEGLPTLFCQFISHVCSLGFDEKPDYQYLHSILSQCSKSQTETEQSDSSSCSAVSLDSVRNQM